MTLAELIKQLADTTQFRLFPNLYTEIWGIIIDKDDMSYLQPYMEKKINAITVHIEDNAKIVLVLDDEEVEA